MFQVGFGEAIVIAIVAVLLVGPERLPKYAAEAGRMLRQLRRMAHDASSEIRAELGPEFDDLELSDLHPKRFVRKHLLEDLDIDDGPAPPTSAAASARRSRVVPLEEGERPPYDADAT